MLSPDQLRQRYQARQQRLAREGEERASKTAQRRQASSANAVAEAIARAQARRLALHKDAP